ncbi:MAG: hypothetical protein A3I89_01165 [Candidatus Harrisonbacteria bacterium RIFCSPLOWO2_02_FULL_41_11]|uniref:Uncharacterized protein n=1 Tax=Candidatus Harrisonbacteria bacterium RIFCSPHIGHO2_02_FULL_42_16 TaxID=1798404 RepID=A0A1G1ZI87_9BACT|nr:MAG: hypothetical protein A3B92_00655 [Candidatus Harrisonbacteria bacterium RIFCSPHIGHO2_02_FULL_42_16]OGY67581.1 MAG: hypothetical protein A3I89_01165 [Candidatus Harrisonbacteria bacterium RIFCSPLOWO2_02_FULL_41_11]
MRKVLVTILVLATVGGVFWYIRNDLKFSQNQAAVTDVNFKENISTSLTEASQKEVVKNNADLLKAQALKIISRPISVKIQISDNSRKNALAKLDELIKLIRNKYDYVNAWYDLGAYRMVIGDYDGAIEAYQFVPLIKSGDYIGYVNLGDIYSHYLKNYPLAEENFLKALKNNSAYVSGYVELAVLYENYFESGYQKAEDLLLSGIRFNEGNLHIKIKLAEFYERNAKKSEALALFKEVLSLDPNNKFVEAEVVRLSQ